MADSRPYWGTHDSNASLCLRLGTTEFPSCQQTLYSATHRLPQQCRNSLLRPQEGDQVVPSFQRLTVLEGHHKRPKPLPPPPDPEELMSDEAADSEVEFFTSDQCSLLPKSSGKAPCFRATGRGSYSGSGQVNYAYQGVPSVGGEGAGCTGPSWTRTEDGAASTGWSAGGTATTGATSWAARVDAYGNHGQPLLQRGEGYKQTSSGIRRSVSSSRKPPDGPHSSGLRYSYPAQRPDPPGIPALSPAPAPRDKPVIPPRVPILPPKSSASARAPKGDGSVSHGGREDDKPPVVPPRVPLVAACSLRTPSPKSLPIYINGVMPATQSFAPNPKYVRRAPLPRQQRAQAPPADQNAPCIVPIMEDGRQASATHYFLLPRPAYQERLQRILGQSERADGTGAWPATDLEDQKR
ncbi:hypothetical protein NHX12_013412 [Muraenolepis orangiensis]|uniref:ERBB receptor feedback inhibitor 1 n=1 Tax=Muraenolepis orangiensis TaxID=630683 RepID=A0A9Q0I820_9TELE|nr:hypothetical protein NHX12_013412 [Muraenolepis orangiensis]